MFSKIFKGILFLFVFRIIFKFIKENSLKYVNIETFYDDELLEKNKIDNHIIRDDKTNNNTNDKTNDETNNYSINECSTLVLYKNSFIDINNSSKNKYNLKEIYNNFFNGIKKELKNDINPEHLKTNFKKIEKSSQIIKEHLYNLIVYKNELKNDRNNLKWTFLTKKDKIYKLKSYLKINSNTSIRNIELDISDNNGNSFIYDYVLYDEENKYENIYNFSFILDNNYFNNNEITIKFNFKISHLNIDSYLFDEVFIEITEKNIIDETPILVFDVNENYTPIYFNKNNILDLDEFEADYIE